MKAKKKLSFMPSDKYPPFVMLREEGKVLHPNVRWRAPLFVSVAGLLKGRFVRSGDCVWDYYTRMLLNICSA